MRNIHTIFDGVVRLCKTADMQLQCSRDECRYLFMHFRHFRYRFFFSVVTHERCVTKKISLWFLHTESIHDIFFTFQIAPLVEILFLLYFRFLFFFFFGLAILLLSKWLNFLVIFEINLNSIGEEKT